MYFGPNWRGGHSSGGIPSLSSTWWLAEGATGPVFTTFLLFANPHPRPVEAHLRLVTDFGATVSIPIALPPRSRRTIDVARLHPALAQAAFATRITTAATDPIAVERAMYWSFDGGPWREGHASAGATASAGRWALADGRAFGPEHDQTYILVANASDTEAAEVSLRLLAPDGRTVTPGYTYHVPAGARRTIDVNFLSRVPQRFGAIVESTNRIPIVVERSMYWDTDGVTWAGGTNVVATPLP
jgi:hypothetical protein